MQSIKTKEDFFQTSDGISIYEKTTEAKNAKGVVILVHGIAEHIGRYDYTTAYLTGHGYNIIGWDLRGHGKSSGKRIYIHHFHQYLDDLKEILVRAQSTYPGLPVFLLGHSMGGGIATLFTIEHHPNIAGLLLSGPSLKISDDISPFMQKLSKIVSVILPKLPALKLDSSGISRDPSVVKSYDTDPLNYRKGILARTGAEILKATEIIEKHMSEITCPVLIMHGTADKLSDPGGSQTFYESVSSTDKTLKYYDGLYHEILNEPEKDRVLNDIVSWLDSHTEA